MAPISHGQFVSAVKKSSSAIAPLNILYLGEIVSGVVQSLDILSDYTDELSRKNTSITLYTKITSIETRNSECVQIISLNTTDRDSVIQFGLMNNIDIIHDSDGLFSKTQKFHHRESFVITSELTELTVQLESYLTGHSIPWNFADPVWNLNWLYKYTRHGGLSSTTFDLITAGQTKQYSSKQMEFVRALANKTMHIEHAREHLYYYLQLKRRAFREKNTNNDYSFELTYHLTNYSIYICSAMDILARLINDKYGLGYGRYQGYGISKSDFIQRLITKRKTLSDIFARKRFQEWADWMFVRRNNITHESNLYLTPMVIGKKNKLSDEEMERRVDAEFDWGLYESVTSDADVAEMRAFIKQMLDLQLNYEEVVTDMMTLERENRATGEDQKYIIFPLRSIDDDFKMVTDVVTRAVNNLSKARS